MHYAYVDGKRVSNHLMRDCRTFLRLQEVVGLRQAEGKGPIAYVALPPPTFATYGEATAQGQFNANSQSNGGYTQTKSHIANMIQPVPKSKKEHRNIS
jgi:hypothetical protein